MKGPRTSTWIALLILILGITLAAFLATGGEEQTAVADFRPAPLAVETLTVTKRDYRLRVPAWGFVAPRETIDIRTEVTGRVTAVAPDLLPGAAVEAGAHLFSLDDRDYRNALTVATGAHEQALQKLALELGHQAVARREWALLAESGQEAEKMANRALILREPQLKSCQAAVQAAAARRAQAALAVERTRMTAPCRGVILSEELASGRVMAAGEAALRLACTDAYHLMAAFSPAYPLDPSSQVADTEVAITIGPRTYPGRLAAILPQVDARTRQKHALLTFAAEGVSLGTYAAATLPGPAFKNVVVLPREVLRPEGMVWLLDADGKLEIRPVEVRAKTPDAIVVGAGLEPGERVIRSHIANPLAGMPLRRLVAAPGGKE